MKNTKLEIIMGPMFAGKSTELIRRIRELKILNKKFKSIKPLIDNRYSDNMIVSHNDDKIDCVTVEAIDDFITLVDLNKIDTIFIEEGQFFSDLKEGVLRLLEEFECNVIIVGLDGDFNRKKFGEILDLIPYCDSCVKLSALCKLCNDGTRAIFSHRNNQSKKQIEIGATEYIPLCRKHYLEKNK